MAYATVAEWLSELEGITVRAERVQNGAMPWIDAAWKLGGEAERNRCAKLVPTNWLDPLLTGPKAVLNHPVDNRGIEALLRGIQDRIRNSNSEAK